MQYILKPLPSKSTQIPRVDTSRRTLNRLSRWREFDARRLGRGNDDRSLRPSTVFADDEVLFEFAVAEARVEHRLRTGPLRLARALGTAAAG